MPLASLGAGRCFRDTVRLFICIVHLALQARVIDAESVTLTTELWPADDNRTNQQLQLLVRTQVGEIDSL